MAGLAQAAVEIIAQFGNFESEVRNRLTNVIRAASRQIDSDLDEIGDAAERSARRLGNALGGAARDAGVDIQRLAGLAREAEGALENLDSAELRRISGAAAESVEELRELERAARAAEGVFAGMDPAELNRIANAAAEARRDMERLARSAEEAADEIDQLGRAARALAFLRRITVDVDTDRLSRGFAAAGRGLRTLVTAAAGVAALTSALGGLVAVVGALAGLLSSGAGLLAGLPAAALLAAGAIGTLKLALSGVGEAFGAALGDDAAKFEKSLEGLSPAAQAAAKELRALKPAFDALRSSVQDAFFGPLAGQITAVAKNLAGPLKTGATSVATEFGRLARAVTDFAASGNAARTVSGVFAQLRNQIAGVQSSTITNLLDAVSNFVQATLPGFDGLGSSLDRMLQRLTAFLNRAAAGGQALSWLQGGIATAQSFGRALRDIGAGLANVFSIISSSGGGAVGALERGAAAFRSFTESVQGQQALTNIFTALATAGQTLIPVILALVSGLGTLAPSVALLAQQLGPILTTAIQAVVPALQALLPGLLDVFSALGEAVNEIASSGQLTALGEALSGLLSALAPLLPAFASLVTGGLSLLLPVVQVLTPVIRFLADALKSLAQSPIGPFLGVLLIQFVAVAKITGSVATAFRSLGPTLRVVGTVLRLVAQAVIFLGRALITFLVANPVVAAIAAVVAILVILYFRFQAVRDVVDAVGRALLAAAQAVGRFFVGLKNAFSAGGFSGAFDFIKDQLGNLGQLIGTAILKAAPVVLQFLGNLATTIANFLASLPGRLVSALATFGPQIAAAIGRGLLTVLTTLATWAGKVLLFFLTLPVRIVSALLQFGPTIVAAVASGLGQVLLAVGKFVVDVLAFFITLPFRIVGLVLSGLLVVKAAFIRGFDAVVNFVQTVGPKIGAALANLPGLLKAKAVQAWNSFKQAVSDGNARVVAFVRSAPARISQALSRLGPLIKQKAIQAWNSFRQAVSDGNARVLAFVRSIPGRVVSALSNFEARMRAVGISIMQGLINGVRSLVGRFINSVTEPVRDAINKAKSLIGFGSPAKEFIKIGKSINQGLIKGLQGTASQVTSTITSLIKKIQKAFSGKVEDRLVARLKAGNKQLVALVKQRDKIADTIKAANEKAAEVARSAVDFASVASITPAEGTTQTSESIAATLRQRLEQIRQFQRDLAALAKRGLNKTSLDQIIGQGVESGGQLARTLASGTSTALNEINTVQAEIDKASKSLGKTAADSLYDSGAAAGKGFLAGLKAEKAAIERFMRDLARSLAKTVKKELKISSPSKVFEDIGQDVTSGLARGTLSREAQLQRAFAAIASGLADDVADQIREGADLGARELEGALTGADLDINANVAAGGTTAAAIANTFAAITAPLVAEFNQLEAALTALTVAVSAPGALPAETGTLDTPAERNAARAAGEAARTVRQANVTQNFYVTQTLDVDELAAEVSRRTAAAIR